MGDVTLPFEVIASPLEGVYLIKCHPYSDDRGLFCRWFCIEELKSIVGERKIVNVNYSETRKKGTVRGMHYQRPPHAEMKIVRCIKGSIADTVIDIREGSPTFLQHVSYELSEKNMDMLIVPEGFAHGFQALEDDCRVVYLVTEFYNADCEGGLRHSDPMLKIEWPLPVSMISEKDAQHNLIDTTFRGLTI